MLKNSSKPLALSLPSLVYPSPLQCASIPCAALAAVHGCTCTAAAAAAPEREREQRCREVDGLACFG